ncbi:MAG: hypothetical protein R3326_00205 [Gemmatimonadota bacterium]|nr:hypothetical protein [Gemmatimonadota bacterium]
MTERRAAPLPRWFWIVELFGGLGALLVSVLAVAQPEPLTSAFDWIEAFAYGLLAVLFFASALRRRRTGVGYRGWYLIAVAVLVTLWVLEALS